MNGRRNAILAVLVGMLLMAAPAFSQVKSEAGKQHRASVLLRFDKDGVVSGGCSQTLGLITQSILQIEGVKNVKTDAKNNGVEVSYDRGKTTPEKIVAAFNKDNPDMLLQLPEAMERK
jgi:copper chaperone CopZ